MTGRYVALLRGINVGRAKRVAMADLRGLVEDLGYADVRTHGNSGNVAFSTPGATAGAAARRIELALAERVGVSSRVTVLSAAALEAAVRGNPLLDIAVEPSRLLVAFPADPADLASLAKLARRRWDPEALALGDGVAYLWCPTGILESRVLESVERALGDAVTTRNWSTTTKLLALARSRET